MVLIASGCVTPADTNARSGPLTGTTIVTLTFDDTITDQYQVGDLLAARGLVATFFVNSPRLQQSGYMTLDQVRTLASQGNEIAGHTLDHVDLTTLTVDGMKFEICNDRNALLADGFTVTSFAYPFSADNDTVHQVVKDCGYNSARDGGGLLSPTCDGCPYANPIPPTDPYVIMTNSSVQSTDTLADLEGWVTGAEQHGGGWVPMTFHHICDGCATNAISASMLTNFLDWLAARAAQGTQVATVDQVIGGAVAPAVPDVPPPPPDTPGNLFHNPSLENDANNDQIPDCWRAAGSGTNTATFTRTTNAADGSFAERIDVTSYTDGARRLVSNQDSGLCAPPVTPGHIYTVRAKYISNVQPVFSVYYRTPTGAWKFLAQSPRLPTSSTYAAAAYTTPAMPSDASAISLGLAITAVGSITMDAYELVDSTPPPTTSLLKNPSLEIDANGDQMPDCWRPGGSGTNTATFSRVTNAADGSFAERIDMTSYTNGARRLVSNQDSGACAPPVTPGHTYTVRAKYISNIQPIMSVYYRSSSGTWIWLSQSPRLPASSSYADAAYTTPAMPTDATAISVGLAITGVGFIVMDAYDLVDNGP